MSFTVPKDLITNNLTVKEQISASLIIGTFSGTLVGAAGGILKGDYPNPTGLKGFYSNSLYSIIPLSSSISNKPAAFVAPNADSGVSPGIAIKAGDSNNSISAGNIHIIAGTASNAVYNGYIDIISEKLLNARAKDVKLVGGRNFSSTYRSSGVAIEYNPEQAIEGYITIGSTNVTAPGGVLRTVDLGRAAKSVVLGSSSIPVYTMGQDMRVPQYRTISNPASTISINAGTICLNANSNITMSGTPAIDVSSYDHTINDYTTPDGCRVALTNVSNFDICFKNDDSTNPVTPYSGVGAVYTKSGLKLAATERILKKWGVLELQFQKSGSAGNSGGFWIETNYSNNLSSSVDLSAYATKTQLTAALLPYVTQAEASSSLAFLTASNIFTNNLNTFKSIIVSGSLVQGNECLVAAPYSHAEGAATEAYGVFSHAEGKYSRTYGDSSHAEGIATQAYGDFSHAEGNGTDSFGSGSHAEGGDTEAHGNYSHAEGVLTKAYGIGSHTEGLETTASGNYSHVEGYQSLAYGAYSFAHGQQAYAYGEHSHAEGINTTAGNTGDDSGNTYGQHSEGYFSTASGDYSHAEGSYTLAAAAASHAEGANTVASGANSHAEGVGAKTFGIGSHAEGLYTVASGSWQHVQGKYNKPNLTALTIIGNGNDEVRSNILEIYENNIMVSGSLTSSNGFAGDGLNITNITASNINNFGADVRNIFTAGNGITINGSGNGPYTIATTAQAFSDVNTSTITGLTASSESFILCSGSLISSVINIQLPLVSNIGSGKNYIIKNAGVGIVNVIASGSNKIDGQTSASLYTTYSSYSIFGTGSNWWIY